MFDNFVRAFQEDADLTRAGDAPIAATRPDELEPFLARFAGRSFDRGLYRICRVQDLALWAQRIEQAFPMFADRVVCFGYDWLGRVFALDSGRLEGGRAGVIMFEPGTGEALEIPAGLADFHNVELIEYAEAALARAFHETWLSQGGAAPRFDQCIGYRTPLFLGGEDSVENLEQVDLDVYWHVHGQLISQVRGLPPGSRVNLSLE